MNSIISIDFFLIDLWLLLERENHFLLFLQIAQTGHKKIPQDRGNYWNTGITIALIFIVQEIANLRNKQGEIGWFWEHQRVESLCEIRICMNEDSRDNFEESRAEERLPAAIEWIVQCAHFHHHFEEILPARTLERH